MFGVFGFGVLGSGLKDVLSVLGLEETFGLL